MAKQYRQPQHRWFAFVYAKVFDKADRKRMAPLRDFAAGGAHGRVLEIGAGTGANLEHYNWSQVDSLEMTEPDPFMLKYIAPKLDALPPEARAKVRLQEAPAEHLPFGDAEFDCAVVTLVLCTVDDPAAAIAELRRVLKPGGELRLVEHVKASGKKATVQKLIQPAYGWTSGNCQLSRDTEGSLSSAGFELDVSQRTSLGPIWPTFVATARLKA